jgi:hypothetical protein
MDLPDREVDPDLLERFAPGDDVLVNTVDQRPVEVEQERRLAALLRLGRYASALAPSRRFAIRRSSVSMMV